MALCRREFLQASARAATGAVVGSSLFALGCDLSFFGPSGDVNDAYPICVGTRRNCAGGATPWGTWLSCEEVANGLVTECDPAGVAAQLALPALGRFNHEAAAADPVDHRLYLTEDRRDGRFYRFTPNMWGNLSSGLLEVAEVTASQHVAWHTLPDPNGTFVPTRRRVAASTPFNGGEGIAYAAGHIHFATKGDNRIWDFDVSQQTVRVFYDRATDSLQQLGGVDNVAVTERALFSSPKMVATWNS